MSYTFSISYQNTIKKVICKNTASVSQLVALLLEKFKLPQTTNGVLSHNGKNLDALTPLRLSGLVNNSKLVLNTSLGPYTATLKLVGAVDGESISKILKVASDVTLPQMISQLLQSLGKDLVTESKLVELSVMRLSIRNLLPEFARTTVGTFVGSSSNAVVRINIEDKEVSLQKQEQGRKVTEEYEERRKADEKAASLAKLVQESSKPPETKKDSPNKESFIEKEAPKNIIFEKEDIPRILEHESYQNVTLNEKDTIIEAPQNTGNLINDSINETKSQSLQIEQKKQDVWSLPVERNDTLYVPLTSTNTYENPDEDYNLTSNQAEKYYKILKSMQGRPPAKKVAKKPNKYTIRIRFPDRTLLDLHFEDPTTKLGQVLKKLDSYLLENHINNYHLKNGLPPFEEILFGFNENNTSLQDHVHFQQEKILLIWETLGKSSGPYLNPEIQRKDVNELPTVMLENQRGNLEADEENVKSRKLGPSISQSVDGESKPKIKGMPKWFRP